MTWNAGAASRRIRSCMFALAGLWIAVSPAAPQTACTSIESRTSLADMSGVRIATISIETRSPDALPLLAGVAEHLHVRTRESTLRRLLLIVPGEALDTLRVAESLRRLRQLRYLADVAIVAERCDAGDVHLRVVAQDLLSVRPSVQMRSESQAFSITERNMLGTGREVSVGLKSDVHGLALSGTLRDPWFLARDVAATLSTSGDAEHGMRMVSVQKREHSVFDRRTFELRAATSEFDSRSTLHPPDDALSLGRLQASVLAGIRVRALAASVTHLIGGIESDRMEWEGPAESVMSVRRFTGLGMGVRHRAAAYDTLTWLLPGGAIVDVPLALETDAFVALGADAGDGALHADVWAGRVWLPDRRTFVALDLWSSGFRTRGDWSASTVRASLQVRRAATRGTWLLQTGAERWFGADPDVRRPLTTDVTFRALDDTTRRELAVGTALLEREVRIVKLSRSYTLGAALFGAGSVRPTARAGVVGAGIRLLPARPGRATGRLDIGVPLYATGGTEHRWFLSLGISPGFDTDRGRDGIHSR